MWGTEAERQEFGRIYPLWYGDAATRDRREAVERLTALAPQYAPAQFALATAYFDGEGVRRDYKKAFERTTAAAAQQYSGAENMAGSFYAIVKPSHGACAHDPVEAVRWFRRAAEHGSTAGMFNLASCYRTAAGVDRDAVEA